MEALKKVLLGVQCRGTFHRLLCKVFSPFLVTEGSSVHFGRIQYWLAARGRQ